MFSSDQSLVQRDHRKQRQKYRDEATGYDTLLALFAWTTLQTPNASFPAAGIILRRESSREPAPIPTSTLPETKRLQLPHIYSERRAKNCRISRMMRGVSIRTYIKDRDFLSRRLESILGGYTFLGPVPAPPRRRPGDVLFDGVSKREILTEQLSPAGIMWADGWREIRLPWNFRRTRYCSERERRRRRERDGGEDRRREDGRRVTQGIYQARTSPFRIPWYPGDTGRA